MSDVGAEPHPAAVQLGAQLAVVVELAVVGEREPVLDERLAAGGADRSMIDSRRCASAQLTAASVVYEPCAVRTAVGEAIGHRAVTSTLPSGQW